jgi:K+-sensing histidine kinase KdpD
VAIGALLGAVGTGLRIALLPVLSPGDVTFVVAYPAVAAASMASGLVGGLAATIVSVVLAVYALFPPLGTIVADDPLSPLLFLAGGSLISVLGGRFHASRALAEAGRRRAGLVADVSSVLAERLDGTAGVSALTRAVVPGFADWCAIDLFHEDGTFDRVEVAAPDAQTAALARQLREDYPYQPDAPAGVAAVFRTGEPEIVLDVPPSMFAIIEDEALRRTMQRLAIRSFISVPVGGPGGRRFGVLTAVMSTSGRSFEPEDVETTIDLGRRIGVALEAAALLDEATRRADELAAILESIDDPVLVAETGDRIRTMNRAARSEFGDAVGERIDRLLAGAARTDESSSTVQIERSGRFVRPLELRVPTPSGSVRVMILRDVTELLESETARDAFLAMLSHELRTPVTTIYGSAQILQRPLPDETRGALLVDIAAESERLHRLVEDLLVLSRYERGRLVVNGEPVLLERIVGQLLGRISDTYPRLRVTMRAEPNLPPVLADPTYVEQIVRNLVSNAVKYAGDRAAVEIRIRRDERFVVLDVEDDGPGIPDGERDRVFGLYERLGPAVMKPGAGVGLFVCRRLVEAMDGSIVVRRGDGGGACFVVSLPAMVHDESERRPAEPLDSSVAMEAP